MLRLLHVPTVLVGVDPGALVPADLVAHPIHLERRQVIPDWVKLLVILLWTGVLVYVCPGPWWFLPF